MRFNYREECYEDYSCRNKKEYEDGITVAELIVKENVENPEYVTVLLMMILLREMILRQQS